MIGILIGKATVGGRGIVTRLTRQTVTREAIGSVLTRDIISHRRCTRPEQATRSCMVVPKGNIKAAR